jgi:hypothetical protein
MRPITTSRACRVSSTEASRRARRRGLALRAALAAIWAGVVCCAAAASGTAAAGTRSFTVYAVPFTVQFLDHADDRIRGMSVNPFTPNEQALVLVTNGTEHKNGPFPGDDVLYTFKLYPDASLAKSNGTAMFTCYYTFFKQATCESYFVINNDELLAEGQIKFGASHFTLSVSGGTNAYFAAHGEVTSTPAAGKAKVAERLQFAVKA